jgi:HEPN domain-containing protein
MDKNKANELRQWLTKAHHDLRSVRQLLVAEPPLLDTAAYHCQQAAEKALKAFLVLHDSPFSKTHLLTLLVEQCKDIDPCFAELSRAAEFLTPFATSFRYPGEVMDPAIDDVRTGLSLAEKVVTFVSSVMPAKVLLGLQQ